MDTGVKVVDKRKNWEARVEMAVFKLPREELGTYEKLVYAVLCGHASRDGSARLYMKTIADEASCSERQARRSIACLEACNLVARHTQITAGDGQTCNVYEVLGIDEYISRTDSPGGRTNSPGGMPVLPQGADCESGPNNVFEQPLKNKDIYSPTESAEPAQDSFVDNSNFAEDEPVPESPEEKPVDSSEVPYAMHHVVKYFLRETGRDFLTVSELAPIRDLDRLHYPARIIQEIDVAVDRFRRGGRDPAVLTIDYLYQSLKHQPGRKKKPRASPPDKREKEERQKLIEWEQEQQRRITEAFGAGWTGGD